VHKVNSIDNVVIVRLNTSLSKFKFETSQLYVSYMWSFLLHFTDKNKIK